MEDRRPLSGIQVRRLRLGAFGGVAGPLLFLALVVLGGVLYDDYSHVSQKISELGGEGSEVALLQNTNFILLGVLTLGFAWALGTTLGRPFRGPALIGAFAVLSAIANGLLPCDVGCYGLTPVSLAHNVTGLLGFLAAITGMVILARRWRTDPYWKQHVMPTAAAATVASLGLVWFIVIDRQSLAGVAQRTFVGALLIWIAATGWRLFRQLAETDEMAEGHPATIPQQRV